MKYYETTFEEYISSVNKYNLHPEIGELVETTFPKKLRDFGNLIIYGPSGIGKYSQVLHFLKNYSPSELKYEKHMTIQTDKQNYTYSMSDIHYEIDMSFLGCNSKMLWHELFFQIVDIIAVKQEKIGIIVCKNFHMIHSELLEIFYSYMQQYNNSYMNILIKFIIISEHVSFIPTNIFNSCQILSISRPNKDKYIEMINTNQQKTSEKSQNIIQQLDTSTIINLKEIRSFALVKQPENLPTDIFNIVCNQIIEDISNPDIDFIKFRDSLYEILIYNLDVSECFFYIFTHFILENKLQNSDISQVLQKTYSFLKYYNNNYRPIYHLESIFFYLIIKIHGYGNEKREPDDDEKKSHPDSRIKRNEGKKRSNTNKKTIQKNGIKISSG
uniref:Uncharacterized protein n=1 Tax=viral metagenome TaxID=1070528 RepID=A0A6C0HYS5_9ZZZZ